MKRLPPRATRTYPHIPYPTLFRSQDPVFKSLNADDRDLLSRIVRRDQTDEEIELEMRRLVELLDRNKVVFVTHVNATTPDNVTIEQRAQLDRKSTRLNSSQ